MFERHTHRIKLEPGALPPVVAHEGDACADVHAYAVGSRHRDTYRVLNENEPITIPPGGRMNVGLGVSIALEPGWRLRVHARSGLSLDYGIEVGAGVVDQTYRQEISVLLHNHGNNYFTFKRGDRIAQISIERYVHPDFEVVDDLGPDSRGGYGSTGVGTPKRLIELDWGPDVPDTPPPPLEVK
jgi:dUTP pyrophosphatase